jgi:hypothetical protein
VARGGKLVPRTIIWLDEMQLFLSSDRGDGLTEGDLRALWTRHSPVVVIGTMWPDLYDELALRLPAHGQESSDRARKALNLAGTPVRVPVQLEGPEVDRARKQARTSDTIRWALGDPDHGMTQMLAGVPWLVQRWEQPRSPYTRCVLAAAAAVARLGVREPVSAEFLREAARSYFPSRRAAPPDWFIGSLAEATELIRDVVTALIPEPDPADDNHIGYRLTDYLVQYTADGRGVEPVPEGVWRALIAEAATPSQRLSLVHSARQRLLHGIAESVLRQALEAGCDWAQGKLASLLTFQGRTGEAIEHGSVAGRPRKQERAAGGGLTSRSDPDPERRRDLAIGGLSLQGLAGALCTLAADGDPLTVTWAAELLVREGRITEAFGLAVQHEPAAGTRPIWQLLAYSARDPEAVTSLSRRVEDERAADERLAGLLLGRIEDLRRAAAAGQPSAEVYLAALLAAEHSAADLARQTVSGDRCAADALIQLAELRYLVHADEFRRFGLRPDGTIALGPDGDERAVPSTTTPPERAVLLGHLPFLGYG